ncbi:MAG: glycosyltransferase [Candidatus Omnitrophica bacterium]|nr:glycosyltransferase [Candidatus Omnitrophota bacterium]
MSRRSIFLMTSENFEPPLKKLGYEIFWSFPFAYSLFYEGKDKAISNPQELLKRFSDFKDRVLEFKPEYFFAEQWFFINLLSRIEPVNRNKTALMWAEFIGDLKKEGITPVIFCQDDPLPFLRLRKWGVGDLTNSFSVVATHSLQMQPQYKRCGQKVIYFPSFISFNLPDKSVKERKPVDSKLLEFDLFFIGNMDFRRKVFFRLLSKKVKDLDYFFGYSKFYYTSRENIDFDIGDKYYLKTIYGQSSINLVYGSCADSFFNKTWGVTSRIFNISYSKGFFLCDYRRHLADLFDLDPKLYSFRSLAECCKKIRFYLEHPETKKELAEKIYSQVISRYTADTVIGKLMQDIENN